MAMRIAQWVDEAIRFDRTDITFDSTSIDFAGRAGVYTRTLDRDIRALEGVEEDGVELTNVASAALVDATPGSWYFEPLSRVVRIHVSDNGAVSTKRICLLLLEPLILGRGLVKSRNGVPLAWKPRVLELPSITQRLDTSRPGAGSQATYGNLRLNNGDGFYDDVLGARSFRSMRVLRGDELDAYDDFVVRDYALLDDPTLPDMDTLEVPVRSFASLLDEAICQQSYTVSAYPNLDASITGTNIAKVFGGVTKVEAKRVASGRWKLSSLALTAIASVVKSDDSAVTVLTTDLANGEFTVSPTLDTEASLYVTGTGVGVSALGATITALLEDAGWPSDQIDTAALTQLSVDRPTSVGFRVREGSYRDVLDGLAGAAFIDWFVTRAGVFTARARRADQGNMIPTSPSWNVRNATLDLAPTQMFGTNACIRIDKAAADTLAHAYLSNLPLKTGKVYSFTLVAAVISGATSDFRLSTTDSDGNEYFTEPFTLTAGEFIRITGRTKALANDVVFFDSTTVTFDSTVYDFSRAGGELRIYPQYGGSGDVSVLISVVELVDAIPVTVGNATPSSAGRRTPVLWKVLAPCAYDGRTQTRRNGTKELASVKQQFPLAKSSSLPAPAFDGGLIAVADGDIAATAAFTYYSQGRMAFALELVDASLPIEIGSVLEIVDTPSMPDEERMRRPRVPGESPFFRVTEFTDGESVDGAAIAVEGESQFDPTADLMTLTAA